MRTVHASSGPAHEDEIRFPPKRGQLLGKLISRGKKKEIKTGEATQAAKSKNISIVYFIAQVKLIEIPWEKTFAREPYYQQAKSARVHGPRRMASLELAIFPLPKRSRFPLFSLLSASGLKPDPSRRSPRRSPTNNAISEKSKVPKHSAPAKTVRTAAQQRPRRPLKCLMLFW